LDKSDSQYEMTIEEIGSAVARLTPEQKTRLVARLSFELTIAARETYVPGADDMAEPRQIRAYNEMQHRVSACLCELLERRTTEIWIWSYIFESSEMAGCGAEATRACLRAFKSITTREAD
jgi:hypothetical protein